MRIKPAGVHKEQAVKASWRRGLVTIVFALTTPFVFGAIASGQEPLVVTDLELPRGIAPSGSDLLIAEQGTGQILRVTRAGTVSVAVDDLPSVATETPEGPAIAGPSAVVDAGGTLFVAVGEAIGEDGFDAIYRVRPGQEPELFADILAFEEANNPDDGELDDGEPELQVNLYDLILDGKGGLFTTGAASNAVFHVSAAGEITTYAVFPDRQNPRFPAMGGPTMDQVPTGLAMGADGAVYVSTLTGFPFPTGEARIYRLTDTNGDGDASDNGESSIYASGLSAVTAIAFDTDGSLLATEFSTNFLQEAPGRLVRIRGGQIVETVAAPLVSPTAVTVLPDGTEVVTMEFLGIVAEARAAAAIVQSGPGGPGGGGDGPAPAPGGGGTITPPNTGDAGLLGQSTGAWMMYIGGVMLAASFVAAGGLSFVRRSE
jgi:hypothetical protein